MGWIVLLAIAAAALVLLVRLGVSRGLLSFVGAALMLGAAGYALQGRPSLPGSPTSPLSRSGDQDGIAARLRGDMFGRFGKDETTLAAADGLMRAGSPAGAVRIMLAGAGGSPDSAVQWTWLGMAYAAHDANQVSPAARLAFQRALALAPKHPGPPFFYGMAWVRAGDLPKARAWWAHALALTAPDATYRRDIALRILLIDRLMAEEN